MLVLSYTVITSRYVGSKTQGEKLVHLQFSTGVYANVLPIQEIRKIIWKTERYFLIMCMSNKESSVTFSASEFLLKV